MRLSPDSLQIILIVIVSALAVMALKNTKEPVENGFYDDKYDQTQFDNVGCGWLLILIIFCACGVLYGLYWFFEAIHK